LPPIGSPLANHWPPQPRPQPSPATRSIIRAPPATASSRRQHKHGRCEQRTSEALRRLLRHPSETLCQIITTLCDAPSAHADQLAEALQSRTTLFLASASRATDPDPSAETTRRPQRRRHTRRNGVKEGRKAFRRLSCALNPQPGQFVAHQDALHQTSPGRQRTRLEV
jgi:hypothetical protein